MRLLYEKTVFILSALIPANSLPHISSLMYNHSQLQAGENLFGEKEQWEKQTTSKAPVSQ